MANYFDTNKIMTILKDYYAVTHIRIAFLNNEYQDIAGYPNQKAPLCSYIRTSKEADRKCRECDKVACSIARDTGSTYMYQCHAGLYEIIQPLQVEGITVGYLFFAHMMSGPDYDYCLNEILSRVQNYGLDKNVVSKLVHESILLNHDYIKASSRLLETIATYICMEKLGLIQNQNSVILDITNYISKHISEDIQIKDICRAIGVGKTKLCSLSKEYFKMGIHDYIRAMRINKAKELMINTPDLGIDEIALKCGFSDYNYFIYIFRSIVGITPKKYIKKYQNNEGKNLISL